MLTKGSSKITLDRVLLLLGETEKRIGRDYCGHDSDSCPNHEQAEYRAEAPCLRCRLDVFFAELPAAKRKLIK